MIGMDDFKAVMGQANPGGSVEETDARERARWTERGVDYDDLTRWCMEQAVEDIGLSFAETGGFMGIEMLGGYLATAYHLGLNMGWTLRERAS